jgi:hypothetical protein
MYDPDNILAWLEEKVRIKPCKILPKLVLSCHLRSYRELEDVAWQENGL